MLSSCTAGVASCAVILTIRGQAGGLTAICRAANPLQIGHLVRGFSGFEGFEPSSAIAWWQGTTTLLWARNWSVVCESVCQGTRTT